METFAALAARFALDLALKATLIFCVSAGLLFALRRSSASARHLVATLGLFSAALLPLFVIVVPHIPVPVLPAAKADVELVAPRAPALALVAPKAPVARAEPEVLMETVSPEGVTTITRTNTNTNTNTGTVTTTQTTTHTATSTRTQTSAHKAPSAHASATPHASPAPKAQPGLHPNPQPHPHPMPNPHPAPQAFVVSVTPHVVVTPQVHVSPVVRVEPVVVVDDAQPVAIEATEATVNLRGMDAAAMSANLAPMAPVAKVDQPMTAAAPPGLASRMKLLALWSVMLFASAWACGALLLLARLALGVLRAERVITRAATAPAPDWIRPLSEAVSALGIQKPVRLLLSSEARVAMTAGALDPVVVLPAEAREWSPERRKVVLLHELAHVRRGDWLTLVFAELSLSLWWFHPLAWKLAKQARKDAEQAADDLVLESGTKPSDYASHLVALVRGLREPISDEVLTMAMARSSAIEERLKSILDPDKRRAGPRPLFMTAGLFAVAAVLAALHPVQAAMSRPAAVIVANDSGREDDSSSVGALEAQVEDARVAVGEARGERARARAEAREEALQARLEAAQEREQAREEARRGAEEARRDAEEARREAQEEARQAAEEARQEAMDDRRQAIDERSQELEERQQEIGEREREFEEQAGELERNAEQLAQQTLASVDPDSIPNFDRRAFERNTRESVRAAMSKARDELRKANDQLRKQLDERRRELASARDLHHDVALQPLPPMAPMPPMAQIPPMPPMPPAGKFDSYSGDYGKYAKEYAGNDSWSSWSRSGGGNDWYSRGMSRHHAGRYKEAIEAFQRSYDQGQNEGASAYNIACGYARLGDKGKAIEWLRKAADEGFDVADSMDDDDDLESIQDDAAFTALRKELHGNGESRKKAKADALGRRLQRLLDRKSTDAGQWNSLGHELLSAGDYGKSAEAFQKSAALAKNPGNALYNTACALSLKGDKKAALDFLEKAIEAGFDNPKLMRKDDDLDDIRDDPRFAQLLKLEKDLTLNIDGGWSFNWSWGGKHGLFSLNSDKRHAQKVADWKEELPRIEQAAKDHPKSGRAQYNVGYARLMVDDPKGAEDAFKKALELGHRKPTTLYNLACAAARQDAKDRAFDYLSKSIDAGFDAAGQMENDDDLDSLRDDPRFRKLVRKAEAVADDQDD